MIHFKKIRYKNFLSTGQQFIEVQLDRSSKTLVVGENGAGKSTMLDALCFGLFQRAFRNIKKDQVITLDDVELNLPKEVNKAREYQYNLI